MKREEIKEKELELLAGECKKYPLFFERKTFVDDSEFLEKFGFFIKGKEELPLGYTKLWPQDFIVEEVLDKEDIQNIDFESFFSKDKKFSNNDPTIYSTLVKCGLSTIEAVEEIKTLLKTEENNIQFAGIKDKDALTSQSISVRGMKAEDLQKIVSPYLFLKNIYSGKGVMEIGNLKGNQFTILVRTDNDFQEKRFLVNLKNIEKEGFYNFFYLQRFGTPRLINFHWGLFILKGEYQKAILSFLCSPGQRELPYFQKLREKIKESFGNWEKINEVLTDFPIIFQNERKIVNYLKNNPSDFIGALNQIPQQIQLWLFAYSSWLFNKKLALYLKQGLEPPQKMPLILSKDEKDWLFYQELLKENKIFSMPVRNLKPFPYVQLRKREINAREKAKIHHVKIIKEGVILNFFLPKAAYATTFLAHLFNLTSGLRPENISTHPIDTKATLGKESLENVLNKFKDVIRSKDENVFEKFSQNE